MKTRTRMAGAAALVGLGMLGHCAYSVLNADDGSLSFEEAIAAFDKGASVICGPLPGRGDPVVVGVLLQKSNPLAFPVMLSLLSGEGDYFCTQGENKTEAAEKAAQLFGRSVAFMSIRPGEKSFPRKPGGTTL